MAIDSASWLCLPTRPREVFATTPLTQVICQIRFSSLFAVSDPAAVAPFQSALKAEYPIARSEDQQSFVIQLAAQGAEVVQQASSPSASVIWRFQDKKSEWSVSLSSDFVALETRAYESFEEFASRLDRVLRALESTFAPTVVFRAGIRYVNEFRVLDSDWSAVIRPEALGPLSQESITDHLQHSLQHLVLRGEDGTELQVRQGVVAKVAPTPESLKYNAPEDRFYLLDIDSYREFEPVDMPDFMVDGLISLVGRLRATASVMFRWTVVEGFESQLMGGSNAAS